MGPGAAWLDHLPQGGAFFAAAAAAAAGCAALRVAGARTGPGRAFLRGLHALEAGAVALLLAAMLVLSFGQILLRNIAHTGLLWVDPLLRHLLLWVGFSGAMLATRLDRHINVDAFTRLLGGSALRTARCLSSLGAGVICVVLLGACVTALREEAGARTVGFLGIPVWYLQSVMPLSLFVMSARFFRHAVESIGGRRIVTPPPAELGGPGAAA